MTPSYAASLSDTARSSLVDISDSRDIEVCNTKLQLGRSNYENKFKAEKLKNVEQALQKLQLTEEVLAFAVETTTGTAIVVSIQQERWCSSVLSLGHFSWTCFVLATAPFLLESGRNSRKDFALSRTKKIINKTSVIPLQETFTLRDVRTSKYKENDNTWSPSNKQKRKTVAVPEEDIERTSNGQKRKALVEAAEDNIEMIDDETYYMRL
ncbi:unnamed protein product [Cylicocyclus nassatus]|uniref:Uncharacterized protein n=1 Tax=Cylicocyclus nassatus TaxID=53992 RepID=A0AA36DR34_CYLNA|nr:unnamed protein product [Cylicocyclus nassatus]